MTSRTRWIAILGAAAVLAVVVAVLAPAPNGQSEEAQVLVRFQTFGAGAVFNIVYELYSEGILVISRVHAGGRGLVEQRRLDLDPLDTRRYLDLLEQGGYFTAPPEQLRRPEVLSKLGIAMDLPYWKIEVYRSHSEPVLIKVPARLAGEFHPELREIPYVATAWELLTEFDASWNRSEGTAP